MGRYTAEVSRRLPALLPGVRLGFHVVRISSKPPPDAPGQRGEGRPAHGRRPMVAFLKAVPLAKPAARALALGMARWAVRGDLYWAPNHALPAGVHGARNVVTIHDLSWMLHPQWHPRDRVSLFHRLVPQSVRRADVVITVSRAIRDEVAELLGVPVERIRVIPNGVDRDLFRLRGRDEVESTLRRLGLARPFVAAVGTIEPRKNLETLLAAWSRLDAEQRRDHELVIAGGAGWQDGAIRAALASAGATVRTVGRVDDDELAALYGAATALAYPSVYEGFGLPPMEALSSGTLPIVADIPVMREVVGESGVLYGQPRDAGALAGALELALSRGPPDAATRERRRAAGAGLDWDRSARAHAEVFAPLL